MLNQVRVVIFIQVLNSLVGGVLGVALPLMMQDRDIDIVTIGLVFAAMPMIFQLGRIFFATVSDFWGRRPFFVLNGALSVISNLIYYVAHTPLEFLFGKVIEGTKSGSLWAVNRAFLLEKSREKWRTLVHLRTTAYISLAIGSLMAGFLTVWFFYEGTLLMCALLGIVVVPLSLMIIGGRKRQLSVTKAIHLLDFRNKTTTFKRCLVLFFVMGLSFGFLSGFVFPLFLSSNGFDAETIGILLGVQIFLAGLVAYFFEGRFELRKILLASGVLHTIVVISLGVASFLYAALLIGVYGVVEGLLSIGQEGILYKITNEESYGTDIGLLMMGLHSGRTISIALAGLLISIFGFIAPFLLAALIYVCFYLGSYRILR